MQAKNITRRDFFWTSAMFAAIGSQAHAIKNSGNWNADSPLLLGGPVLENYDSPEAWVHALQALGYRAAYCPVGSDTDSQEIVEYRKAASEAGITIAEVGVWRNTLSPHQSTRSQALEKAREDLDLADKIGARCCVNVSGTLSGEDHGPHPQNLSNDTFDLIVETTRTIIDAVKPSRTFFVLETMPWAFPDSAESYLELIRAVGRPSFAAHLDPVNIINSPRRYYDNAALIRDCFKKLGPFIKSCHAKDTILRSALTTHIDEVRPGKGILDYSVFLSELSKYPEIPLMMEHLQTANEYRKAANYIRSFL